MAMDTIHIHLPDAHLRKLAARKRRTKQSAAATIRKALELFFAMELATRFKVGEKKRGAK